jgi:hypothetical protein
MSRQFKTHHDTSIKTKVQDAYQYLLKHEISFDLKNIFAQFDVSNRTNYRIIQDKHSLRRHRDNETRDRKRKIIETQWNETDRILQDKNLKLKEKRYTWEQLVIEIETDVIDLTMRRIMQSALNYHKCLVCVKEWLAESFAERWIE